MKIQLVDDEPYLLKAMQRELRGYVDWETHTYVSADDALVGLREHQYDIIICDYNMPSRNGIDYLCRARDEQPKAIRVLLTAWADEQVLADAINLAQVHRYWAKPWQIESLLKMVKECRDKPSTTANQKQLTES